MKKNYIPDTEFTERLSKLQSEVLNSEMDAIMVFSTESEPAGVRYFSDYWPSFETAAILVSSSGDASLLIGPESQTYARSRSKIEDIIRMKDFRESSMPDYPGSELIDWDELLHTRRIKKLGIAGWHMLPHSIYSGIVDVLGGGNVYPADGYVRKISLKKSPAELDCLRGAARISEIGFQAVLEQIKPGMTEAQLVGIAAGAMMEAGAEATGYPIWCCSGPNSIQAISRPTNRHVKESEIIHFSIGAKVAGYSASIGRPVVLGKCPTEIRKFLEVGLDAEKMTIDLMHHGTPACEVAYKVHSFIQSKGYGEAILYGPAHGCGQMECEFPFVETSSEFILERDMVFMVDIFLANSQIGFRWEDGVIIHEGMVEELSNYKRQINIL